MKMAPQQYCLRWKHHHTNVQNMFAQLLEKERFCDVTLYCSPSFATQVPNKDTVEPHHIRGVSLRAHRVVLAACSELLGALLGAHEAQGEPVLVIDGAEPKHLKALLDYMYTGEMNVHHSQLASLLKTAEELRIKGLTDIRWNNKDEPPDCDTGVVTAVPTHEKKPEAKSAAAEKQLPSPKHSPAKHSPAKQSPSKSPKHAEAEVKKEDGEAEVKPEKFNVNGGPPPLIKLPTKEKLTPPKREQNSDSDSPSPKRQRLASGTEHTDDESVSHSLPDTARERDAEWQHGNLDITAERVVGWGQGPGSGGWSRDGSDEEWADAPADIGSFLHTRLKVDGDNSADEDSNDSGGGALSVSSVAASSSSAADRKPEVEPYTLLSKVGPKSGNTDPRFTDVVKLTDYLQHGRRPQFWEEHYVKRVMEAVRMKELEMKQAAEILGVSYGTLYGRYRDVYGCINRPYRSKGKLEMKQAADILSVSYGTLYGWYRDVYGCISRPYRTARDFWQAKGPSEVLERLQRGEVSVEAASLALGVSVTNLAAYMADFPQNHYDKDFDPIPIDVDPSLKMRTYSGSAPKVLRKIAPAADKQDEQIAYLMQVHGKPSAEGSARETATDALRKMAAATPAPASADKAVKKIMIGSLLDEETIPATVITTAEPKGLATSTASTTAPSGKWPTIRVASLESLRGAEAGASPSALMRTRPDLTIVAARARGADRPDDAA